MRKDIFYSSCGAGKIHAAVWEPEGDVKGIVQIVHGIAEHVDRYEELAAFLNDRGYLVAAEDHMGHGRSAQTTEVGVFHGGWHSVVKDTAALNQQLRTAYPDVPYVLLGHSMGSFIARTLLTYPDVQLDACILSGTAWMPKPVIYAGKMISGLYAKRKGDSAKNQSLQNLMFSGYNKRIKDCRTPYDWLTTDATVVDKYIEDPMCGFLASAGLLRDMLTGLIYNQKRKNLLKMDKNLPVHFIAGTEDPVGDYGRGVSKAVKAFQKAGLHNVTCKLYEGKRHELHNEDIKEQVYSEIYNYICAACCK